MDMDMGSPSYLSDMDLRRSISRSSALSRDVRIRPAMLGPTQTQLCFDQFICPDVVDPSTPTDAQFPCMPSFSSHRYAYSALQGVSMLFNRRPSVIMVSVNDELVPSHTVDASIIFPQPSSAELAIAYPPLVLPPSPPCPSPLVVDVTMEPILPFQTTSFSSTTSIQHFATTTDSSSTSPSDPVRDDGDGDVDADDDDDNNDDDEYIPEPTSHSIPHHASAIFQGPAVPPKECTKVAKVVRNVRKPGSASRRAKAHTKATIAAHKPDGSVVSDSKDPRPCTYQPPHGLAGCHAKEVGPPRAMVHASFHRHNYNRHVRHEAVHFLNSNNKAESYPLLFEFIIAQINRRHYSEDGLEGVRAMKPEYCDQLPDEYVDPLAQFMAAYSSMAPLSEFHTKFLAAMCLFWAQWPANFTFGCTCSEGEGKTGLARKDEWQRHCRKYPKLHHNRAGHWREPKQDFAYCLAKVGL